MDTITLLIAACAAASFSQADTQALFEAIKHQAVKASLCRFVETQATFWLIEVPGAWPPQSCTLDRWPALRLGEHPNPNFCGRCGHDSTQPDLECTCACHDIFAVIVGTPVSADGHQ